MGDHRLGRLGAGMPVVFLQVQSGISWAAEQRVEPLHVRDQLQVSGAGFDTLRNTVMQALDPGSLGALTELS